MTSLIGACSEESPNPVNMMPPVVDNDDLNPQPPPSDGPSPAPGPGPTPAPPEVVTLNIDPSELNKNDTTIVYRGFIKPVGLKEPRKHKKCPDRFENQCLINRQVLFQFNLEEINQSYPQELWDVSSIELHADYFSFGEKYRTELFCILNLKKCSGKAITKIAGLNIPFIKVLWRNPKFWRGRDEDHIMNELFHIELLNGKLHEGIYIRKGLIMDLTRTFNIPDTALQTLVRKNNNLQFTVTDDTFVEFPNLQINLRRRLPSRD